MCGIVGYAGCAQAGPILIDGLRRLEYRGYDSSGIAVRAQGEARIRIAKAAGKLDRLIALTGGGRSLAGESGVGHTRWATHGEPGERNAHPIAAPQERVVMVHNGIIENHAALRAALEEQGCRFTTQTDTEAAVLLLDRLYARAGDALPEQRALDAIREMTARLSGSYAMGILFADQPGTVYAVRRESPLLVGRAEGAWRGHILASDMQAVLGRASRAAYLEDGDVAVMTRDALRVFGADHRAREIALEALCGDVQTADKGGYAHFMLKEIMEQPAAVRDTIAPCIRGAAGALEADLSASGMTQADFRAVKRVLFVGCGSAYHAGLVGREAVHAVSRLPCACEIASELRYSAAPAEDGTLAVVISQSGETADSLAALRRCRGSGMKTLAVVNAAGCAIAREADAVLYTRAGPEIAVATTKAYAAQLAAVYLLAISLAKAHGAISSQREQALLGALVSLPQQIESMLGQRERMARFARRFARSRNVFFVGRGLDYALCMEGSLKLKEISYVNSQAYAAGELKHGAISLIEKGTLVIGAATQAQVLPKTLLGLSEARARGAYVFALLAADAPKDADAADETLALPPTEPLFAASAAVTALQLLAYFIALELGHDVDKPRNLAKSVTVE